MDNSKLIPAKAYCDICQTVTPCEWRAETNNGARLSCTCCDWIHVGVHEFKSPEETNET